MRTAMWSFGMLIGAVILAATQEPPRSLAIEQFKQLPTSISVHSRAFTANGTIPAKYGDYGEKVSPELSWAGVPPSAKSLVSIVEDPDAKDPKPFVHWVLYNLPPSLSALPESVPGTPRLPEFGGALQGRSSRGTTGYFGPRPPRGDAAHHYHFQVFALDTQLDLDPNETATVVLAKMKDHVVGRGELIGLYRAP